MKKQKGITLVSIVVTIIVLIILATITISATLGENGIITIAKKAKENMEIAKTEEEESLNELYIQIASENTGNTGDSSNVDNIQVTQLLEKIENLEIKVSKLENTSKTIENIYPVGSIYISTDISTAEEVATKLGGTWESYAQGRTLVGVGTGTDINSTEQTFAANESGGEYTHTLTIDEMPSHSHYLGIAIDSTVVGGNIEQATQYTRTWYLSGNGIYGGGNTSQTGSSLEHNIVQPYITVYMWRRTS